MARREPTPFDEVVNDLRKDKQFRKEQRRVAPYFDLALDIIKRRLELGLTQKELAELANTFQSRISKIESGEHDIRFSTLIDIAEALECEVTKNILIPLDAIEYEPPKNNFETVGEVASELPLYNNYINIEDYQYA